MHFCLSLSVSVISILTAHHIIYIRNFFMMDKKAKQKQKTTHNATAIIFFCLVVLVYLSGWWWRACDSIWKKSFYFVYFFLLSFEIIMQRCGAFAEGVLELSVGYQWPKPKACTNKIKCGIRKCDNAQCGTAAIRALESSAEALANRRTHT